MQIELCTSRPRYAVYGRITQPDQWSYPNNISRNTAIAWQKGRFVIEHIDCCLSGCDVRGGFFIIIPLQRILCDWVWWNLDIELFTGRFTARRSGSGAILRRRWWRIVTLVYLALSMCLSSASILIYLARRSPRLLWSILNLIPFAAFILVHLAFCSIKYVVNDCQMMYDDWWYGASSSSNIFIYWKI